MLEKIYKILLSVAIATAVVVAFAILLVDRYPEKPTVGVYLYPAKATEKEDSSSLYDKEKLQRHSELPEKYGGNKPLSNKDKILKGKVEKMEIEHIKSLIGKLKSAWLEGNKDVWLKVEEELIRIGKPAVPYLIDELYKSGGARYPACKILEKIKDPRALKAFVWLMREHKSEDAIEILGRWGDKGAIPFLLDELNGVNRTIEESDYACSQPFREATDAEGYKITVAGSLSMLGSEEGFDAISSYALGPYGESAWQRHAALDVLTEMGKKGNSQALEVLLALAECDGDPTAQIEALRALKVTRNKKCLAGVLDIIRGDQARTGICEPAIQILGEIGGKNELKFLEDAKQTLWADVSDDYIIKKADQAIKQIKERMKSN